MIITSQGFGHFTEGINNQDFGIESERCLVILDGCSDAKYSEVGTRLFAQLLSRKEDWDNVEKFEDNVKCVFEDILKMMRKYYPTEEKLENEFIMENLLFTIIACFVTEHGFVVKVFGDGYIVTKNRRGLLSYIKLSYGKCPPYFAYKYCPTEEDYKDSVFKTFYFSKEFFSEVGIATDGIMPIAKGDVKELDNHIKMKNMGAIDMGIRMEKQQFFDDVTIGIFGGSRSEK